jgi:hypothetical protein
LTFDLPGMEQKPKRIHIGSQGAIEGKGTRK